MRARATFAASLLVLYGLVKILNPDRALLEHPALRYASAFGIALFFASASFLFGHAALRWLLGRTLRLADHAAIAFAVGISSFHVGVFLLGIAGALNQLGCVALPVCMLLVSLKPALRTFRRVRRLTRAFRGVGPPAPRVPFWALLAGGPSLLLLFARTLTSASAGYDSLWYHLPLAETYLVGGAIRPVVEGWPGGWPQMASILYAWALSLAGGSALGLTACAQVEFTFLLSAVFGVVPLARALIPRGTRLPWAWMTVALFPAWHLYGPQVEADCLVAGFAPALGLTTLLAYRAFEPRKVALCAFVLGSAALVKLTAFTVLAFPCLALAVRAVWLLITLPRGRREVLIAVGAGLGTGLLLTSTFWLKNWIFYSNPVYPELRSIFGANPWNQAAEVHAREVWPRLLWKPLPGSAGWQELGRALFTFSFQPHEYSFHNPGRPLFGSLFTLSLPVLIVMLPAGRRALGFYAGVLLGIAAWFKVHHQDRYLEALLPWMMAITATAFVFVWRAGVLARGVALMLGVLQLVWTYPFAIARFPYDGLRDALDAPSVEAWTKVQSARYAGWSLLARELPPKAVVLVHEQQMKYGIRRRLVSDEAGFQARLSYVDLGTDVAVYDALRELGVTHLYASSQSRGTDAIGGDLAFFSLFSRYGVPTPTANLRRLADERPPPANRSERLVYVDACGALPEAPGLYRLIDLKRLGGQEPGPVAKPLRRTGNPASDDELRSLLERAEFLVLGNACQARTLAAAGDAFKAIAWRANLSLLQRPAAVAR